jgi:outer membrane protein, multidrug efflux system
MDGTVQRGGLKPVSAWVPAGLPSELLLRRPDLKQAEMNLAALNADIGAARAQYFPSISLTSYLGRQSIPFSKLFTGEAGIFQFAASITQPIFNAGSLRNMVKAAEAARDQALVQYKRAVANAFADVRDALSEQTAARQVLEAETTRSKALAQAYKQAQLHYQSGISSHLDLLIVENNYLQAELNRLDAERAQRVAVADLFKALGGGWQDAAPGKPETP